MKKLGFGCMRLPMNGEEVNYLEFSKMIKAFMDNGFTYFDTAHGYLNGKSEIAIHDCLTTKYDRNTYTIADKLTDPYFNKKEDIRPFFESQLKIVGVDYFDYYLMHAQSRRNYPKFKACEAYKVALELKAEGKIKHFGISFHDTAEYLDKILTENPEIEFVQIQFNYADYYSNNVQSKLVYDTCIKHHKKIVVMEPVKGGNLVNLPDGAKKIFDELNSGMSYASYAIRFAASHEDIFMVLSGMSNLEQMEDNISYMKDFIPLSEEEKGAVLKAGDIFNNMNTIQCTACKYCEAGCPKHILIPSLFACFNQKEVFNDWNSGFYYNTVYTEFPHGKASSCIECGRCEMVCPQKLPIRELLKDVAKTFEKA